jgi:hypothetical protein
MTKMGIMTMMLMEYPDSNLKPIEKSRYLARAPSGRPFLLSAGLIR